MNRTDAQDDGWFTTSEELIDALGPVGKPYARPREYSGKYDYSYINPTLAVVDRERSIEEGNAKKKQQEYLKEKRKNRRSQKEILTNYLLIVEPIIRYQNRCSNPDSANTQLNESLLKVFDARTLRWLKIKTLDVSNVMDWAWVLTADTSARAALRLKIISAQPSKNEFSRAVPQFLFTLLLRRQDIDAPALETLLVYIWKLMESLERPVSSTVEERSANTSSKNMVRDGVNGMNERSFIIIIIRLLRRARMVWPAACESVIALLCRYLNGLNFHKSTPTTQGAHDVAQLTFVYNTMLRLVALPSRLHPFQTSLFQQRAQFSLLRRMDKFAPPLIVDRRGYQAVIRMQLRHKKTLKEREWAHMKAKSWPPWKEEKLGLDAAVGAEDGISRAKEALNRAKEAGYATDDWDAAAAILSGWDTDNSPTIQTRSDFGSSLGAMKQRVPQIARVKVKQIRRKDITPEDQTKLERKVGQRTDNQNMSTAMETDEHVSEHRSEQKDWDGQSILIWAARIQATRTLEEAWSCFLACKDQMRQKLDHRIYHAMFTKITYNSNKALRNTSDILSDDHSEHPLPGDGLEMSPAPESPREALYVSRPPPSFDELFEMMRTDGIWPRGRFLSFLLAQVLTFEAGVRCLEASILLPRQLSTLLGDFSRSDESVISNEDAKRVLSSIPRHTVESYVHLLTRLAPTMKDKAAHSHNMLAQTTHTDIKHECVSSAQSEPNTGAHFERKLAEQADLLDPLTRAIQLLRVWKPTNRPVWYHLLRALARPKVVTTTFSSLALQPFHDIKTWRMMCSVLDEMFELGVSLDVDGFVVSCRGLEKAIFASEHIKSRIIKGEKVRQDTESTINRVLSQGLPLVKGIFKDTVRATGMQQQIPKEVLMEKAKIDEAIQEGRAEVGGEDQLNDLENRDSSEPRAFLPPGCLLPRLLEAPSPAQLHAFIRVLGLRRDYDGLLDLIEWMSLFSNEIDTVANEAMNGRRMMRRCLTATRVFLERSWMDISRSDGASCAGHNGIVVEAEPAKAETVEAVRTVVSENQHWGGWATDDEVLEYCSHGRFV